MAKRNRLDADLYAFAAALFEERLAAEGPAFAARLARHQRVPAGFQKVCRLVEARSGLAAGEIEKPKG